MHSRLHIRDKITLFLTTYKVYKALLAPGDINCVQQIREYMVVSSRGAKQAPPGRSVWEMKQPAGAVIKILDLTGANLRSDVSGEREGACSYYASSQVL